jgi:hypothetical protein
MEDEAERSRSSVVHTWAEFLKTSKNGDAFNKPAAVVAGDDEEGNRQRFPTALLDRLRVGGGNGGSTNAKYNYRYSPLETDQQVSLTMPDGQPSPVTGTDGCDEAAQGGDAYCDPSVTLAHSDSANSFSAEQRAAGSSGPCTPVKSKHDSSNRKGL